MTAGVAADAALRQEIPVAVFPARRASVRQARSFVASALSGHARCEDAVQCCSELAANAAVHAGGVGYRVAVVAGHDWAYVAVTDAGRGRSVPHVSEAGRSVGATSGRGLALVSLLASAWGAVPVRGGGWRVWCEFESPATGSGRGSINTRGNE